MPATFSELDPDHLKSTLANAIESIKQTIAHYLVELEIERAVLEVLDGDEYSGRHDNLRHFEQEIVFNKKKLEVAKAKLADLD
jgi:hypothetical protein